MPNLQALKVPRKDCTLFPELHGRHGQALSQEHYHKSSYCIKYQENLYLNQASQKDTCQSFLPQNFPESKISNPTKSFHHHRHLKFKVPLTVGRCLLNWKLIHKKVTVMQAPSLNVKQNGFQVAMQLFKTKKD